MSDISLVALAPSFQTPLSRVASEARNGFGDRIAPPSLPTRGSADATPALTVRQDFSEAFEAAETSAAANPPIDAAAIPTVGTITYRQYLKALSMQWFESAAPRLLPPQAPRTGGLGQLLDVSA